MASKTKTLEGKTCVVTGAGRGIGRAVARILASAGASGIALVARTAAQLEEVKAECESLSASKVKVLCQACDVTDEASVAAMREAVFAALGHVDIVINNAGRGHTPKPFWELTGDDVDNVMAVNVKGVFLVTKALLTGKNGMLDQKSGCILMMSSACGVMPVPTMSVYNVSKFGLEGMTKVLAKELEPYGVRCLSVSPGRVVTEAFPEEFGMVNPKTVRQPEDIRECMLHLLTEGETGTYTHAGQWDFENGVRGDADAMAHLRQGGNESEGDKKKEDE